MSQSSIPSRKPKWHIIYYVLAAFDLLTISGSLYLNHQIMGIYTDSVSVSKEWAEIQGHFIDVGRLASIVNAPGNDVFDTGDVDGELAERNRALEEFEQSLSNLRQDVVEKVPPNQAVPLLRGLEEIETAMNTMVAEADLIFSYFREDRTAEAGRRMATMDRKYAGVTRSVARASNFVRGLQAEHFDQQIAAASSLRTFEYLIGGFIALMVGFVTFYGHMIAKKMKEGEEEKATYLTALRQKEEALEHRVDELSSVNHKLEKQGKELEEAARHLRQARDEAVAANSAKSQFLALMSHELRTPLNAIIGYSEIIKLGTFGPVGSPRYCEYAKDINDSGQHLLDLISDILDLSKIESGTSELEEDEFEIHDVVRSVLTLVRDRASREGVQLEQDLADGLPVLRADKRCVKQILVNLLSNGIKFTEEGGKVTLRVWSDPESGYFFQVADTGIGITDENIPKALVLFGQVDSALNRKHDGTGLGLPLTKSLVENHGGTLDLQSEVGLGTTVTVRFPAERVINHRVRSA